MYSQYKFYYTQKKNVLQIKGTKVSLKEMQAICYSQQIIAFNIKRHTCF